MPLLAGFCIIVLAYADWHAPKSVPQHLARILAENNQVLYVEMPRSFLRFLKGRTPAPGEVAAGPRLQQVLPNLHVLHPPHRHFPVGKVPFTVAQRLLRTNGLLLAASINQTVKELGFRNPLIWNFSPIHGGAVPHLEGCLHIHDICDEWSNYIPDAAGRQLMEWADRDGAQNADVLFVFSEHMRQRREGLNPETHVILPGGDVDHYSQASDPGLAVPADLLALPKPVIGAICVVDPYRFDPPLLAHMGKARPDWSIAVVGPVRPGVNLDPVQGVPNVHIMGDRPLASLPAYLKGMDVALIPYALNDATRGIYPMKTQEYLAGGKPVVAPPLPACAGLEEVIYFADSHEDFVAKTDRALREDTPARHDARQAVAQANGWRQRLAERSSHILRLLEAKQG
ncbi:MAG: glycosyltransferase [Candidatus Hydrogenedentes bacterium]|nr:glycosyltransferase [Candidatus Hydrogenedentota bacterium]